MLKKIDRLSNREYKSIESRSVGKSVEKSVGRKNYRKNDEKTAG